LYERCGERFTLAFPKDAIRSSFPTATIRSASFKIITCDLPDVTGVESSWPGCKKPGRVFAESWNEEEGSESPLEPYLGCEEAKIACPLNSELHSSAMKECK
jgi:hypothetical protein